MTDEVIEEVSESEETVETVTETSTEEATKDAETTTETTDEVVAEAFKWPETWQQELANEYADGDEKAASKALKTLGRYKSPAAMFSKIREQEDYLRSGGLVKLPGKDATEEDIENFHKALGVPEKPEDYIENLTLSNGVQLGDDDKEIASAFVEAAHKSGATQEQVNGLMDWYFGIQTEQASALDQLDDADRREAEKIMQEEYGPKLKATDVAIKKSFGSEELYNNLMNGRLADGTLIANSPAVKKYLAEQAMSADPMASVIMDHGTSGQSLDEQLKEIDKFRRENKRAYFNDEKMQARERELLAIQERLGS